MQKNTYGIVIVAAGRGERAGTPENGPKQYRQIGGQSIIRHSLDIFLNWKPDSVFVLVIHPDDHALLQHALTGLPDTVTLHIVHGGATRQKSVLAGLTALAESAISHVMIHDAVRPFVAPELLDGIDRCFADGAKAVLPATAVIDTLKRRDAEGYVQETVPRAGLYGAQTPQCFEYPLILAAHRKAAESGKQDFTDDASIAEWAAIPVRLIEGSPDNFKITTPQDLQMADQKMARPALIDVRCGNGYDVHQLVPGDGVTLCGVTIDCVFRLSGHSDADVALHALTDALLATCGAGDIGDHFPPSDPQWKGAPPHIFLAHAAAIVRRKGGTIMNADISIIAEVPRISPHRDRMRANLAEILSISIDRCSVKATTNEKIGFIGRQEGIAAIATATVVFGGTEHGTHG
ncbi:MAG: hypothetical protein RIR97_701 [Pseudomonadota bacterium]